ncbi:ferritin-like domain-containing protein [Pleurocapsales cyanobacterium LEGE 06147]|nr:ferritin-like domain-containing protein [Pleurocapsales cyanobacterium LEGE 06147]
MNFLTSILNTLGSGATAYILASNLRDPLTRPNTLAGFQLAESGSVPFLEKLSQRATAEGDTWLAEKLALHAADERRHGQIFARALKQLGKQVINLKQAQDNLQARSAEPRLRRSQKQERSPFFDTYFEGYTPAELKPEQMDWIVFMGSTYILELDASKDFARMARVLPEEETTSRHLKQGILSVARDETRHAAYLYEALQRRLSQREIEKVVEDWRERKVKAMFAMVANLIQKGGKTPSLVQDGVPTELESQETELLAISS